MRVFADKKGYAMAYTAILLSFVLLPLLILSIELTRVMYVDAHLQAATDAACSAASQASNVPHFILTGELMIDITAGRTYAYREFDRTVSDHNIKKYTPVLTSVNLLSNTMVACQSTAQMQWVFPGIAPVILTASAISETQARR